MSSVYIVLFPDGSMIPTRHKPTKDDFPQAGTRFFSVDDSMDMASLSYWFGSGFNHHKFKELHNG